MRNKAKDFPTTKSGAGGEARAKAKFSSKRADGTINTNPSERMQASNQREE
ncbi:small acid-soluble spore protein K (minor) [Bacillus ectoiniformans]|uniref:small acid-soluble spore protein K n=1 Tax=Bacillus ectoiniformans TaxID=1494429 RepID=UPI00195CB327|nr:small acid-soluble spore protein K [Bacillus ectoiniformans]MBM7649620.1 small acid-soluble spore protein K (minor) [Bacillus ectoiniformans]